MAEPVIIGFARSAFARAHRGSLKDVRPDDLAAKVARELVDRLQIPHEDLEDLLLGCAYPEGEQGNNLGRIVTYLAGLPLSLPGMTTNRLCGSSMQTIHTACGAIRMGAGEVFLCGGVESMSRIQRGGFNLTPNPNLLEGAPDAYISMGLTAENLAEKYSISRSEQEQFALLSHQKAATAASVGNFSAEIVSIDTEQGTFEADECIRAQTSLDGMARLKPAFDESGSVTAATSSPLTDGAAFTIICSEEYAAEQNITPLAKIISTAVVGCPPEMMGIGPVEAISKALRRAGLELDQIDVFELNEAFAAQVLAVLEELPLDQGKVNIDGGALALGHPLGASGARITGKTAALLRREGGRYGLAAMCIGGGMGIATVLESIE